MDSLETQMASVPPALTYLERAEQQALQLPQISHIGPMPVDKVGIVGGGTMGCGIAVAMLLKGFNVTLLEQDDARLAAARKKVMDLLSSSVRKGKLQQDKLDAILTDHLHFTLAYKDLSKVDLVIEAVFEDLSVKQQVFVALDKACRPNAILATNTSYLNVDKIAAMTTRPQNVIGLHFFSPAYIMRLLEIVIGAKTAPKTIATGLALAKMLGKVAVSSGVCDGFIANRVSATARAAANATVLAGASPYEIDTALMGFGFPMGPFAMGDLAGLDIGWAFRKQRGIQTDAAPVQTFAFQDRICENGWFGRKTGKGYYIYEQAKGPGTPNPEVLTLIEQERAEKGIAPRTIGEREIVMRYLAAMANEGAKLLEEKIAQRPSDVDLALVYGYAFPKYRGGPLFHADQIGLPLILQQIKTFMKEDQDFWAPAPLLAELVEQGKGFADLNDITEQEPS